MTLTVHGNNGQAPADALRVLPGYNGDGTPHTAPHVTAQSYARIREAMIGAALGDLLPTDGWSCYRDRAAQQHMIDIGLTTIPVGQSIHGEWSDGSAVDFADLGGFGAPRHDWLRSHGGEHGWYQPGWAQAGGSLPEPWHWEYDERNDEHIGEDPDMTPDESQRLLNIEGAIGRLEGMWGAPDGRNRVHDFDLVGDWTQDTQTRVRGGDPNADMLQLIKAGTDTLGPGAQSTAWTPAAVVAAIAFGALALMVVAVVLIAAATGSVPVELQRATLYLAFVLAGGLLGRLIART
jgi:hypothetical protein